MTSAHIVRLVPYVGLFGDVDWLPKDDALTKLAHERELYDRWRDEFPGLVQPPCLLEAIVE